MDWKLNVGRALARLDGLKPVPHLAERYTTFVILRTYGVPGPFVVAVSGGIDSTALLLAMKEAGIPIVAAHVNHHLRGAESDEDEAFVRRLC